MILRRLEKRSNLRNRRIIVLWAVRKLIRRSSWCAGKARLIALLLISTMNLLRMLMPLTMKFENL